MVLCLREPPGVFVLLIVVVFLTGGFYVSGLLFLATGTPSWLLRSVKASTSSELYPATFGCCTFARLFRHSFTASATVMSEHFLPTGVSYLTLLLHIFGTFCEYAAGRNSPSTNLLCACAYRVVPSG